MEALEHELKQLVIQTLSLEDLSPEDIDSEEPLFDEGLGLDSVDILEVLVAVRKAYGVTLSHVTAEYDKHLANVRALALFVSSQRKP